MFLSKIWFVLVCLVGGVALSAAFVAPRSANRQLQSAEADGLDRAQYAAEQMLKTDAHRWIDYVAKLGRDALLTEALDSATRGAGEGRMLHETVRGRLQALVPGPSEIGIDHIVAVDGKGKVVARLGGRDKEYGDSVSGLEVVADGLRGYLSDDVWSYDGQLVRVAAAPVLAKTRDRIVGVVYVAAETGQRLTEIWKKNLGVDVALLLKGQVVSSTLSEGALGSLGEEIGRRKGEIDEAKRTRAFTMPFGSERLLAVAAPFAGQAAELGAYYVLLSKQAAISGPMALLASATSQDLGFKNFPWIPLVLGVLALLAIGVFLQRIEMEAPLRRLRGEVQKLARGELQKLQDAQHPGKFGGIARDVNAALERYTHAPAPPATETAGKDLNAILGQEPRPTSPRSFELPSVPGFGPQPTPSQFAAPPLSGFGSTPPSSPGFASPMTPTGPSLTLPPGPPLPGPAAVGAVPGARLTSPAMPAPPRPPMAPPAPAIPGPAQFALGNTPTPVVTASMAAAAAAMGGSTPTALAAGAGSQPLPGPSPTVAAPPSYASVARSAMAAAPPQNATVSAPHLGPTVAGPVPTVAASAIPTVAAGARTAGAPVKDELDDATTSNVGAGDDAGDEAHFRDVFADYIRTRERCGEPVAGLTLDKFRTKLEANRQALVAKYGCRSAKFSVYVKDGKAAIKASPVR